MLSKKTARMGDEGKAVGCVPPTALLSELFFGGLSGALRFLLRNNILPGK
jgi:hypothetical protein